MSTTSTTKISPCPSEPKSNNPPSRQATPPPLPNSIQTPDVLADQYKWIKKIGKGTQGQVYLAKRLSDNKKVAIKELRIDSVKNWKAYDLFARETQVLSSLQMEGVAEFYDSIEVLDSERPAAYIVQAYIEGRSLEEMIHSGYRFTIAQFFKLAEQLILLLEQLHHHDPPVIHRDIKPSNIMLRPNVNGSRQFDVFLIDFGAVANPQVQGGGSTVAGTYGYMPPEQLTGNPMPASDIYSLGAMLVYMLSGVSPAEMEVSSNFRLVIEPHLENIPRSVVQVLQMMLDPNPTKRLVDHQMIAKIFNEFAYERFDTMNLPQEIQTILARKEQLSFTQFVRSIVTTKSLVQDGNFDTWVNLPDHVTRYKKIFFLYSIYNVLGLIARQIVKWLIYLLIPILYIHAGLYKHTHIIFSTIFFIYMYNLIIGNSYELQIKAFSTVVILTFLSTIAFTAISLLLVYALNKDLIAYKSPIIQALNSSKDIYYKLLFKGQKAIATITSIHYISPGYSDVPESIQSCIKPHAMPTHIAKNKPCFCLRYKFNPVDDSLQTDLIHEIIIYEDIREKYQPGSRLPILYYLIKKNNSPNSMVASMLFPFPFYKLKNKESIICFTYDGLRVNKNGQAI